MIILYYIWDVISKSFQMLAWSILPCIIITLVMQFMTRSIWRDLERLVGYKRYIYISSPGVAIHELSHAFFCLVFGHKIRKLVLFSVGADGTLGYVEHSYNPRNIYQRIGNFFIGTGPVWGGFASVFFLSKLLLPANMQYHSQGMEDFAVSFFFGFLQLDFWTSIWSWLWLYLVVVIISNITLSKPDIEGALDGLIAIVLSALVVTACCLWAYDLPGAVMHMSSKLLMVLVPVVATISLVLLLLWVVAKLLKRLRR